MPNAEPLNPHVSAIGRPARAIPKPCVAGSNPAGGTLKSALTCANTSAALLSSSHHLPSTRTAYGRELARHAGRATAYAVVRTMGCHRVRLPTQAPWPSRQQSFVVFSQGTDALKPPLKIVPADHEPVGRPFTAKVPSLVAGGGECGLSTIRRTPVRVDLGRPRRRALVPQRRACPVQYDQHRVRYDPGAPGCLPRTRSWPWS
jgi:hypothetical protein